MHHGPFSQANYFYDVVTKGHNRTHDRSPVKRPFSLREYLLGVNEVQMLLSLINNARNENKWMTLTQKKEGFFASIDACNWTSKQGFASVLKAVMDKKLTEHMNILKDECISFESQKLG